jgi:hypothetical protein
MVVEEEAVYIMADRKQRGAMTGRGQDTVPKDMPL